MAKELTALIPDAVYRPEEWPRFTGLALTACYDLIREGRLAKPVRPQGQKGRAVVLFGRDFLAFHELLRQERVKEMEEEAEAAAKAAARAGRS